MKFAADTVTDLADTLGTDAGALARALQSDVLVDAPAILHALAVTALHLSTSAAEMAQAVDDVNGPSADELRAVQVAFAECSSTLLNIIEPVQRFAN
ncbi:hypothetical protein [Cryptosporangium arvum]|jgi:hypothetical protein|uniref:Uncharacterized protein n=1 Tax=Cryptosporangium arvum DSM 44712 TaxID=927661 RepID=A0A010YHP4_9ACTN|nr:hypothetical protein [Cryptosporangium arvum]EXG79775.1 hypothetical protein CryarDRAFT_0820 [Cryptosporangium arvum DSM 44712]